MIQIFDMVSVPWSMFIFVAYSYMQMLKYDFLVEGGRLAGGECSCYEKDYIIAIICNFPVILCALNSCFPPPFMCTPMCGVISILLFSSSFRRYDDKSGSLRNLSNEIRGKVPF